MIEIIVAIILQITTIVGGTTEKDLAEQKAKAEKSKKEQTISASTTSTTVADGGAGTWNDD